MDLKVKAKLRKLVFLSGIATFGFSNFSALKTLAEPLPLRNLTFTNTAIAESVALVKTEQTTVDTSKFKYFALEIEISPKSSAYSAFNISLIDSTYADVVSLSFDGSKLGSVDPYPNGLSSTDFASATGGCRVVTSPGRINLPTTEEGYFVAQKTSVYYSTIKTGFKGTIFYYLPDYTNLNSFSAGGIKFANNDSKRTTIYYNSYFCESIQKVSTKGFQSSEEVLDYKCTQINKISGSTTINTPFAITANKGVKVTSSGACESIVSFDNEYDVNLEYLAIDMEITSAGTNLDYLNGIFYAYDKDFEVSKDFTLSREKIEQASNKPLKNGLSSSDFSSAVGGKRVNLQDLVGGKDYSRISYLTSIAGQYVPVKSDNSYNFVFKVGVRYTTFIYLPDFGSSFKINGLGFKTTTSFSYSINQIYLCERVNKIINEVESATYYKPTGQIINLPLTNAQAAGASLELSSPAFDTTTYFKADIDSNVVGGTFGYSFVETSTGLKIQINPVPYAGYKLKTVIVDGNPITETEGKYITDLTKNVVVSGEFEEYYESTISFKGSSNYLNYILDSSKSINRTDYLAINLTYLSSTGDQWGHLQISLILKDKTVKDLVVPEGYSSEENPTNGLALPEGLTRVGADRINCPSSYRGTCSVPNKVIGDTSYFLFNPSIGPEKAKFNGIVYIYLGDYLTENCEIEGISLKGHNSFLFSFKVNEISFFDSSITNETKINLAKSSLECCNVSINDSRVKLTSTDNFGITKISFNNFVATISFNNAKGAIRKTAKINGASITLDSFNSCSFNYTTIFSVTAEYAQCSVTINEFDHGTSTYSILDDALSVQLDLDNGYKVTGFIVDGETKTVDSNLVYGTTISKDMNIEVTTGLCLVTEMFSANGTVTHKIDDVTKAVTYTVKPSQGFSIKTMTLNGVEVKESELENNELKISNYHTDLVLFVEFEHHSVSVINENEKGTVTYSVEGDFVTIEISPKPGYYVSDLFINDVSTEIGENNKVVVAFNKSLVVKPVYKTFEATASFLSLYGEVTSNLSYDLSKVIYSVEPKFGYMVEKVYLNDLPVCFSEDGTIEANNDRDNHLIVLFKEMISAGEIENAIVSYELDEINQKVIFTIEIADGYEMKAFTINGQEVDASSFTYECDLSEELVYSVRVAKIQQETSSHISSSESETNGGKKDDMSPEIIPIIFASAGGILTIAALITFFSKKKGVK